MLSKSYQHLDDEALLELYYSTRSTRAFRTLYNRHRDSLYRYCALSDPARAAGVFEALWSELLQKPPALRGGLLRNWLYTRASRVLRAPDTGAASQDPTSAEDPVSDDGVFRAIRDLPRLERNVLLLHRECQLSLAAIADIERLTLKAVRACLQRGQESLRLQLFGPERQAWRISEGGNAS